jgi:hypothetical protein
VSHLADASTPHAHLQAEARRLAGPGMAAVEHARDWPYTDHDLHLMRKAEIQAGIEEVLTRVYVRSVNDLDSARADRQRLATLREVA